MKLRHICTVLVGLPALLFSIWYGFFWIFGYFGPLTMAEAHEAGVVIGLAGATLGVCIGILHTLTNMGRGDADG